MYTDGHTVTDVKRLPLNLLDALRALEDSTVLRASFGEDFAAAYLKLRMEDWNAYTQHLTQWEKDTTLDC
jgi:glutamine synthetase